MILVTCYRYLLPPFKGISHCYMQCISSLHIFSQCIFSLCNASSPQMHQNHRHTPPFQQCNPSLCIFSLHCAMQLCTRGTLHPPPAMHLSRNRWDAHLSVCNKHQWSKGGRITNLKEFNHFRNSQDSR